MSDTLAAGERKEIPAVDATAIDRLFESLGDASTPLLNFA
jgi:hypothetical protein